jgi:hypothetical protein
MPYYFNSTNLQVEEVVASSHPEVFHTKELAIAYGIKKIEMRAQKHEQKAAALREKIGVFNTQALITANYPKKTVEWWLQQLPEPYRSQAFANCNDDYCDIGREMCTSAEEALSIGFNWHFTPEKEDYWVTVYRAIKSGEIALLPEPEEPDTP